MNIQVNKNGETLEFDIVSSDSFAVSNLPLYCTASITSNKLLVKVDRNDSFSKRDDSFVISNTCGASITVNFSQDAQSKEITCYTISNLSLSYDNVGSDGGQSSPNVSYNVVAKYNDGSTASTTTSVTKQYSKISGDGEVKSDGTVEYITNTTTSPKDTKVKLEAYVDGYKECGATASTEGSCTQNAMGLEIECYSITLNSFTMSSVGNDGGTSSPSLSYSVTAKYNDGSTTTASTNIVKVEYSDGGGDGEYLSDGKVKFNKNEETTSKSHTVNVKLSLIEGYTLCGNVVTSSAIATQEQGEEPIIECLEGTVTLEYTTTLLDYKSGTTASPTRFEYSFTLNGEKINLTKNDVDIEYILGSGKDFATIDSNTGLITFISDNRTDSIRNVEVIVHVNPKNYPLCDGSLYISDSSTVSQQKYQDIVNYRIKLRYGSNFRQDEYTIYTHVGEIYIYSNGVKIDTKELSEKTSPIIDMYEWNIMAKNGENITVGALFSTGYKIQHEPNNPTKIIEGTQTTCGHGTPTYSASDNTWYIDVFD